jgi:hypothetical protein
MSCYLRHMKEVLDAAGIKITADNRKEVDKTFHEIVGVIYKNCPATWRKLKQELAGDDAKREKLVQKLKRAMGS